MQAIPATGTPKPPVTTPDVAVLHGQQPAVVDVLADDYDPQGWILGVTGAASEPTPRPASRSPWSTSAGCGSAPTTRSPA